VLRGFFDGFQPECKELEIFFHHYEAVPVRFDQLAIEVGLLVIFIIDFLKTGHYHFDSLSNRGFVHPVVILTLLSKLVNLPMEFSHGLQNITAG
jgi:hypothetical protein